MSLDRYAFIRYAEKMAEGKISKIKALLTVSARCFIAPLFSIFVMRCEA